MSRPRCPELEREVVAAYRLELISQSALGKRFGISASTVRRILAKYSALDPHRLSKHNLHLWRTGHYTDRPNRGGRRPTWPDCPPELRAEYMRLRDSYKMPAREARAILEGKS